MTKQTLARSRLKMFYILRGHFALPNKSKDTVENYFFYTMTAGDALCFYIMVIM